MKHIGFITSVENPHITQDDLILKTHLESKNVLCKGYAWNDPEETKTEVFDLLLFRSCYDYYKDPLKFENWLDTPTLQTKTLNAASLVKWNMNKRYLLELLDKDVAIPKMSFLKPSADLQQEIAEVMETNHWDTAILKPAISTSAYHTEKITKETFRSGTPLFKNLEDTGTMILQEYVPEIASQGELSLIFFKDQFSHGVIKRVKQGDFRVQKQFGGTVTTIEPDKDIIRQAQKILFELPEIPFYSRIDGYIQNGKFHLIEVELIEPVLFFKEYPEAASRFSDLLIRELKN